MCWRRHRATRGSNCGMPAQARCCRLIWLVNHSSLPYVLAISTGKLSILNYNFVLSLWAPGPDYMNHSSLRLAMVDPPISITVMTAVVKGPTTPHNELAPIPKLSSSHLCPLSSFARSLRKKPYQCVFPRLKLFSISLLGQVMNGAPKSSQYCLARSLAA
jgi:hypothetical protein